MIPRTGSPEREAWHEAGHAVVAHLLGGRIREVTLESDDDAFEGRVTIEWPAGPPREVAARSAQAALAGPLAELARYEDEIDPTSSEIVAAWSGDWAEVERCAAVCAPDPEKRTPLIERWFRDTGALLARDNAESLIGRIADALDAHGTLDEILFEDCL